MGRIRIAMILLSRFEVRERLPILLDRMASGDDAVIVIHKVPTDPRKAGEEVALDVIDRGRRSNLYIVPADLLHGVTWTRDFYEVRISLAVQIIPALARIAAKGELVRLLNDDPREEIAHLLGHDDFMGLIGVSGHG